MAKLRAFAIPGFELWFNSNDHLPPHFHAEKTGDWEVRVYFLRARKDMFTQVWPKSASGRGRPRRAELNDIAAATELHRDGLYEQWERDVLVKTRGADE